MPDVLSDLILVQTICKCYKHKTLEGKEINSRILRLVGYSKHLLVGETDFDILSFDHFSAELKNTQNPLIFPL